MLYGFATPPKKIDDKVDRSAREGIESWCLHRVEGRPRSCANDVTYCVVYGSPNIDCTDSSFATPISTLHLPSLSTLTPKVSHSVLAVALALLILQYTYTASLSSLYDHTRLASERAWPHSTSMLASIVYAISNC